MIDKTIRISKDGEVTCVYKDDLPFAKNGQAKLVRASNVLWDEALQKWKVVFNTEGAVPYEAATKFDRRADAIDFEVNFLETRLEDGFDPAPMFQGQ